MSQQASDSEEMLRRIAVAAGRYGFSSSIENGVLRIRVWDTVIAGSGRDTRIRIVLERDRPELRVQGLLGSKRIVLPRMDPGLIVAAAYYAWLERNKALESRIIRDLVRAGRRAGPKTECPKLIDSLPGMSYAEGLCTRLASMLAFGAYKARALLGVSVTDLSDGKPFFPPTASKTSILASAAQAYASLVRTLRRGYDDLDAALREGERLFDEHRYVPGALKVGLVLSGYLDRLRVPWKVYVAALLLAGETTRLVRSCRGLGLVDAGLVGEAEWLRTGNGTAMCDTGGPVALGLSLALYSRTGSIVGVLSNAERSARCACYRDPVCRQKSVVLDPGERALRVLASCVRTGECSGRVVYHKDKPVLAVIDSSGGEEAGMLRVASIPGGRLSLEEVVLAEHRIKLVGGVPRGRLTPEALGSYAGALRALLG